MKWLVQGPSAVPVMACQVPFGPLLKGETKGRLLTLYNVNKINKDILIPDLEN